MSCGWLGCTFDQVINVISSALVGVWEIIQGLFVALSTIIQILFTFFQMVEVVFSIITDPGLLIMVILTCINFYAAFGGTRKEVVNRYITGTQAAARAVSWLIMKIIDLVMRLIGAIIDII